MDSETRIGIHCKAIEAFEVKNSGVIFDCYMDMKQEVKRLQAVNAELLEALESLFAVSTPHIAECVQSPWQVAKSAIEKHWKGE